MSRHPGMQRAALSLRHRPAQHWKSMWVGSVRIARSRPSVDAVHFGGGGSLCMHLSAGARLHAIHTHGNSYPAPDRTLAQCAGDHGCDRAPYELAGA